MILHCCKLQEFSKFFNNFLKNIRVKPTLYLIYFSRLYFLRNLLLFMLLINFPKILRNFFPEIYSFEIIFKTNY